MINQANINSLWASLIVEEFIRLGINRFCISPGSRSTPLALAAAENDRANPMVHFDERGCAFYALGQARATGVPSVLICTSGTAVVNYYPAVVEARMASVPMIILSADRPLELRQTGANQTINQVELFGTYACYFHDLQSPNIDTPVSELLEIIDHATYRSQSPDPGPVHLNCPFREPLEPVEDGIDYSCYLQELSGWLDSSEPYGKPEAITDNTDEIAESLASTIRARQNGLVIIGCLPEYESRQNIIRLVNRLGWPTLCDVTSGLRFSSEITNQISYYDQILLAESDSELLQADRVLHFGGSVVSKRLLQFLDRHHPTEYIQVKTGMLPFDPNHQVTERVDCDPELLAGKLIGKLASYETGSKQHEALAVCDQLDQQFDKLLNSRSPLTEASAARLISQSLPESHALFLASSMTIRQFDMYGRGDRAITMVGANRGASGIDGTLATAVGFASGLDRPTTVVIGDLAMLHDLNSLALIKQSTQAITVVILNNNGGRIFEQLPIAKFTHQFERFFIAPTNVSFEKAAEMFGIDYFSIESSSQLLRQYQTATQSPNSTILELTIIPQVSRTELTRLNEAVRALLNQRDD